MKIQPEGLQPLLEGLALLPIDRQTEILATYINGLLKVAEDRRIADVAAEQQYTRRWYKLWLISNGQEAEDGK